MDPYTHPRQRPEEVAAHYNLHTGGYSVHEHGVGTVEDDAPAVLLFGAFGRVLRSGHRRYLESLRDADAEVTLDRRWLFRESEGRPACVPGGELVPPERRVMAKRNLFAWSVGTRGDEGELRRALADAEAGLGGWRPAGFDARRGCFARVESVDGRMGFGAPLPQDRSVDVLLVSVPNVVPGSSPPRCKPLYRPAGGHWRTPPATAPGMYWRPARSGGVVKVERAAVRPRIGASRAAASILGGR